MGKKNKYKDKKVVISVFNESQSHYKKYKELKSENLSMAQQELNLAGNKLQQAYELGLKCYLNYRYSKLYQSGVLSWRDSRNLVETIENGKDRRGQMVDIKYLKSQMDLYADPDVNASGVNFDLIRRNANFISNDNKHRGDDVEVSKYEESYAETRKFILTYIDDNPQIQMIQSPEYNNLQEACDFWESNSKYNYCLICDRSEIDDSERRKILYINWSLVIDFDENTENDGFRRSYTNEYMIQPNSFNVLNPRNTIFDAASNLPYWFHINGVQDIQESVPDTDRKWNQKYGAILSDCICKYRESFSKPLKVIILGGNAKRIEKILSVMDAVYEDTLKLFLLSQEVQFEVIRDEYQEILEFFPMTPREFAQGINNFSSLFNRKKTKNEYNISGRVGKVGIKPDEFSSFEIPYFGIEDDCNDDEMNREFFYQGRMPLSWYGIKNGFAIDRITQYRRICDEITIASKESVGRIINLYHDPGAGGTTLARVIAYNMSKIMPVAILKSYNEKITPTQLLNLYRKTDMSSLIVVEKSLISDEDLQKLIKELRAKSVPHVILYVQRINAKRKSSDDDLKILTDDEFYEMQEKLSPYIDDDKKILIQGLIHQGSDRYPFFMSMYAFEDEFKGVKDYVAHYLDSISKNDFNILSYVSLVDKYANRSLDISFLRTNLEDDIELFENETNNNLITLENIGHNSFVKIRHVRFAEEIIRNRIDVDTNDSMAKANSLSSLIREFINYSKQNIMYDLDSTIEILKSLLIMRDTNSLVTDRFAPVIEELKRIIPSEVDEHEKFNCIGLVFKELVKVYPEEAHFKAHLSRYYTYIERNYDNGIKEAREAVEFAEDQGWHDPLLHHIYGMSIRRYIEQRLYSEAKECHQFGEMQRLEGKIEEIREWLTLASEQFKSVRETNNKVAGFISDIEMCISLIDFGKELYNLSTEQFIENYRDSWIMEYYDRALTLMEGFRSIQVEEDTDFYRVKLSSACNDSLQDMIYNIENTVDLWEDYLRRASDMEKPVVRRFIARAKEKTLWSSKEGSSNAKAILTLMEENIRQEPQNGANIRIWFNALRYSDSDNPEMELDEALQKLGSWKQIGDSIEAYYYYFVLVCIKAIEKSSRAEAVIPELEQELKAKTSHMPNNKIIYEWLGRGRGIRRLINAYELVNGKYKKRPIDTIAKEGEVLEGRISKFKNDRSAQIQAYNMEVFFSPAGQADQVSAKDITRKVKFVLGFCYDGLRALNKSVHLIEDSPNDDEKEDEMIGKTVKCIVQKPDVNGYFVNVKLFDYHNSFGSIHYSDLPEGKSVSDYSEGDPPLWGTVIGVRKSEKDGRLFYKISLKEEKQELEDWQKQLSDIAKDLR